MVIMRRLRPILPYAGLVITILGLITLLVVPVVAYHITEGYRLQIEDVVDPARRQIGEALEVAHSARSYALSYYFLLGNTPHEPYPTPKSFYDALVARWERITANDSQIAACDGTALLNWQAGKRDLSTWLHTYGEHYIVAGDVHDQTRYLAGSQLYQRGAVSMDSAREQVTAQEAEIRERISDITSAQMMVVVAMSAVCLLLAVLAWQNVRSLQRAHVREREIAARLDVAARETNHRVKNNLQIIGALVDMQMQEPGDTVPKQALLDIEQQVRAMAAVHDFLTRQRQTDVVPADQMLRRLTALTAAPAGLNVEVNAESIPLTVKQATALALIANELLLNSNKHGATCARVEMHRDDGRALLEVVDNGPGFALDFDPIRDGNVGLALVDSLTRNDLAGEVTFANGQGAQVDVSFPYTGVGA